MADQILIQGGDFKVRYWREALERRAIELRSMRTGLRMVFDFLSARLGQASLQIVVFRYLNDRAGLLGTLGLVAGEWLTLLIAVLGRTPIVWICHNVDRETRRYHPLISTLRRWIIGRLATRVLVTDPLLLEAARSHLPKPALGKLDWLTFGSPRTEGGDHLAHAEIRKHAVAVRERAAANGQGALIGLCLGSFGDKYQHFDLAPKLLREARCNGFTLGLVLGGDFSENLAPEQRATLEELDADPDVLLFRDFVDIDESLISEDFDFFWRAYSDWSTSFTLYVAAAMGKPVLSTRSGFVGVAVEQYGLGVLVEPNLSDIRDALTRIDAWDGGKAPNFLRTHTWEVGVDRLLGADFG